ncbi:MFS transporter [Alicyclobacillus fastidiosus]|uniref:MFS transporter n=1 Tax=Alicyclobacillus fastidiosus TaxID=392011 RepID=A0ABV5AH78_9BACL|nr:MFS transporter [Alicyclobacillus fastidiosus]WEH07957.1 MFS transporter [Alicyclobacillus fastidiosus]
MTESSKVNVSEVIERNRVSGLQVLACVLSGLAVALSGYDEQVMSFVTPTLAKLWGIPQGSFSAALSSGLFGLMVGALISGPIADLIGRKKVIVISLVWLGVFSLFTVVAGNLSELVVLRFITGFGLGGVMPNAIALTSEYCPERVRRTIVSVMFVGFPVGAIVCSLLSSHMVPTLGWTSVFYIGSLLPLVAAIVLMFLLPESIRFLVTKGIHFEKQLAILRRIEPKGQWKAGDRFFVTEEALKGFTVKNLFATGYGKNTILLWFVFLINLMVLDFLTGWMTTVLKNVGFPLGEAIIATAFLQGGGAVGAILLGYLSDRLNIKRILVITFLLCTVSLGLFGMVDSVAMVLVMTFIAGFFVVGSQTLINTLASITYPTSTRSTGVSWAFGVGRIGSIIGPIIGGGMISMNWSIKEMFLCAAVPTILAAIAVTFMRIRPNKAESRPVQQASEPSVL